MSQSGIRSWRYLGMVGALALTYFLMGRMSLTSLGIVDASPVWPPAGVALAALLLGGRQLWPGIALGAFLVSCSFDVAWPLAAIGCFGAAFQAWITEWMLRRIKFRVAFRDLSDILVFLLVGVILSPIVNATFGSLVASISGSIQWADFWANWGVHWLGDSTGILVITPTLLTWLGEASTQKHPRAFLAQTWQQNPLLGPRASEAGLWLGLLLNVSWLVFGSTANDAIARYPLEYLIFPFLVWAALRLGQEGTALGVLVVSGLAIGGAVENGGPFIAKSNGDMDQAMMLLQIFVGVSTTTGIVLAAAVSQQQRAEELLRQKEASLTNAQRIAQLGNWDLDLTQIKLRPRKTITEIPFAPLRWSDEMYRILGLTPQEFPLHQRSLLQVVHPDDRERVQQALDAAIYEKTPYNIEYRILLPTGEERIVNEQVEVNDTRITGTVQNITERKLAEAALRETEQLRSTMYRYMSQELAEQLIQSGNAHLGGKRKEVTVLFSDIRSYTTMTESLEAEEVVNLLNEYFEIMVDVVFEHKGTLDKYIGDAIMAVFGSPLTQTDHAWRAIQTALGMRHKLAEFNAQRLADGKSAIKIGIGVNSDIAITGNIGSRKRMEFTAIGDGVNLSSRLEGATKLYGCDIIISHNTFEFCGDLLWVRELDYIRVKGKTRPVSIYELVGLRSEPLPEKKQKLIELYEKGREQYLQSRFISAIAQFKEILETLDPNDLASQLHINRCWHWLENPPPDHWDGSWNLTEK